MIVCTKRHSSSECCDEFKNMKLVFRSYLIPSFVCVGGFPPPNQDDWFLVLRLRYLYGKDD